MSRFERFSIATFVVIFGCLSFLFSAVLTPIAPLLLPAEAQEKEIDIEEIFKNEFILITEKTEGNTYADYLNNLEYHKEELFNTFKSSTEVVSFIYYDIITGHTFSYNADVEIPTSSSIKASLAIYILDQVSQGKADLNKKVTYTEAFYNGGSGTIKNQAAGTQYTIDQLLEYMMIDSDNVAYLLLLNEFGYKNSQEYWFKLGTTTTYNRGSSWGTITATDGLVYMRKLYSFYREDEHYGEKLMDLFKRARFRYLFQSSKDVEVAHKSGYTAASTNDLSLVFDEHPFIFIVLTKRDAFGTGNRGFFSKASAEICAFHQYFWEHISYSYNPY